jgi:glucose dehydrogenase
MTLRWILLILPAALWAANDGATHDDWPSYGGSHAAWRYSALDQINTANVKNLAPKWVFQTVAPQIKKHSGGFAKHRRGAYGDRRCERRSAVSWNRGGSE